MYRFSADSSSPDVDFTDVVWLRMKDYNYLNLHFEAMYDAKVFGKPRYVGDYKFGVVSGHATVVQTKIQRPGMPIHMYYIIRTKYC